MLFSRTGKKRLASRNRVGLLQLVEVFVSERFLQQVKGARSNLIRIEGNDKYHRLLVRITADGLGVSKWLIQRGYARFYQGGHRAGWCR